MCRLISFLNAFNCLFYLFFLILLYIVEEIHTYEKQGFIPFHIIIFIHFKILNLLISVGDKPGANIQELLISQCDSGIVVFETKKFIPSKIAMPVLSVSSISVPHMNLFSCFFLRSIFQENLGGIMLLILVHRFEQGNRKNL